MQLETSQQYFPRVEPRLRAIAHTTFGMLVSESDTQSKLQTLKIWVQTAVLDNAGWPTMT